MIFGGAGTARIETEISVLVVSDVLLYRDGIARGLGQLGRLTVAGASSGAEALAMLGSIVADAILLDASSAESLGIARQLRAARPEIPIVGFGIGNAASSVACA